MENGKKEENNLTEVSVIFLNGVVEKTRRLADHIDSQTNILIGISFAIFIFTLSRVLDGNAQIPIFILTVFSGLSALIGLFAIHPPRSLRKQGQTESALYNKNIIGFSSAEGYKERLNKIIDSREEMVQEYSTEIYNLAKYLYRPKRNLFYLARNILITGILASLITFLINFY
jgi:hypothetical protein